MAHIQSRNVVERLFGVWKRRFPCLHYGMRLHLQKTLTVIVATAVLHNIAIDNANPLPEDGCIVEELPNVQALQEMTRGHQMRTHIINNYFRLVNVFIC